MRGLRLGYSIYCKFLNVCLQYIERAQVATELRTFFRTSLIVLDNELQSPFRIPSLKSGAI